MSIRVLPAALLPSGDKVVSPLAGACWWVVKLSIGFFFSTSHIHTKCSCLVLMLGLYLSLNQNGIETMHSNQFLKQLCMLLKQPKVRRGLLLLRGRPIKSRFRSGPKTSVQTF